MGTLHLLREDLALNGLGNNKLRKARTVIPALRERGRGFALIGGAYSNNVLAFAHLLKEAQLPATAFLRGEPGLRNEGNLARIRTLVPDIHWVGRQDWYQVKEQAASWAAAHDYVVVPEGAYMPGAVAGAATLADAIAQYEQDKGVQMDHIWLDAGTGLTAIATMLAAPGRSYHIVLIAGTEQDFEDRLTEVAGWIGRDRQGLQYQLYAPSLAPRFGKVNMEVKAYATELEQRYGIRPDYVYTTKLMHTAEQYLSSMQGEIMVVLSGSRAG